MTPKKIKFASESENKVEKALKSASKMRCTAVDGVSAAMDGVSRASWADGHNKTISIPLSHDSVGLNPAGLGIDSLLTSG